MTAKHKGSCLCGDVRFEITGEYGQFFLCHCSRCRKGTGTAHAANLFFAMAEIKWVSGQDKVAAYRVPDSRHERSFCTRCGSAAPSLQMNGALLVVPAGCLDTAIDVRPNAHICTASRAAWDNDLDSLPHYDGLPD